MVDSNGDKGGGVWLEGDVYINLLWSKVTGHGSNIHDRAHEVQILWSIVTSR